MMKSTLNSFKKTLDLTEKKLLSISENISAMRPRENKWSAREILGHLIDSAANNHRRFVLAQLSDDLVFPGYDQDVWVRAQNYQDASWPSLVALWKSYNLHIIHLVSQIPEEILLKSRQNHNLDKIAWNTVSKNNPVTLHYFIIDYIGHMNHHLTQIMNIVSSL
ncbi:MAG: DinB family protein [Calditrichaceae bacterium]